MIWKSAPMALIRKGLGYVGGRIGFPLFRGSKCDDQSMVTCGDDHDLILNAFLEIFDCCSVWFVCCGCNIGHLI